MARNVRCGRREIDLVVERGALLVAVEVKWRTARDPAAFTPGAAWARSQRVRAHEAVLLALHEQFGGDERPWRFDLVTIVARPRGWVVEHRPGAWSPSSSWW